MEMAAGCDVSSFVAQDAGQIIVTFAFGIFALSKSTHQTVIRGLGLFESFLLGGFGFGVFFWLFVVWFGW